MRRFSRATPAAPFYRVRFLFIAGLRVTLRKTDDVWQIVRVVAHGPDTLVRFGDELGRWDSHGRVYDGGLQRRSRYGNSSCMKAIRVTFDEALLDKLSHSPEVHESGRPAVLREAVAEYLKRTDAEAITRRYQAGYRDAAKLNDELEGWAEEGVWPKIRHSHVGFPLWRP